MTAFALISGVIFRPPIQKISKAGRPYTTLTVKVGADDGGGDFWSVLSFSESSQIELLRLEVGDAVSIRGKLEIKTYTASDGTTKISRSIFADAAIGLRPAPREKKPRAAKAAPSQDLTKSIAPPSSESSTESAPSSFYSDDIPF
jgi:single-stranded DNA-binding protein